MDFVGRGTDSFKVLLSFRFRLLRKYSKMCQNSRFAVEIRTAHIFRIQAFKVTATQTC